MWPSASAGCWIPVWWRGASALRSAASSPPPAYLKQNGVPKTPQDLVGHNCILYAYLSTGNEWIFHGKDGEIRVKVSGTLRANNGEAIRQAVMADLGIAASPDG